MWMSCIYITLLMLLLAVNSVSPGRATLLRIDCGADHSYEDSYGSIWQTDENFIRTGINAQILDYNDNYGQFNDLRLFREQNKNCYTLPTPSPTPTPGRYFIRAAFFYGNYDGKAQPPTFDLEVDGNRWTTVVNTRAWPPVYYELIYPTQENNVNVCLARTQDNQFPFISTLEIWPLVGGMYEHMPADIAWHKSYRYNYGMGADNWIIGYPTDIYNRIWEGYTLPGVTQHIADVLLADTINYVPREAIIHAVEAYNEGNSIDLSFTFDKANNSNYVEIYFTEIYPLSDNETRLIDIYVDGKDSITIRPVFNHTTSVYGNITSDETLNIQLRQNSSSDYPPVVSSIEVYTAGDPLVNFKTSQDDLNGLETLIQAFEKLNNWSGDPCLPNTTVWQWLDCSGDNPPRVNKLDLSGYGLDGLLPDFHQMQALETIDLSNNSLDGPIPSFLGALPNLKLLNLSGNNFNGMIPKSITKNKNIHLNVTGNPNLHHPKKKNLALIIGLSVGLPVGLIVVVVACLLLLTRRRRPPVQGQPTSVGSGRAEDGKAEARPQKESNSVSTSTQTPTGTLENMQQTQPAPASNINLMPGSNQMPIKPTMNNAINNGNMSVLPGINKEELDELLELHNRTR